MVTGYHLLLLLFVKCRLNRIYWDAKLLENIPQASFQELLQDDTVLLSWLQQLEVMGFVLVSGAPSEPGQVYKLAERVGFIKKTHYGLVTIFTFF